MLSRVTDSGLAWVFRLSLGVAFAALVACGESASPLAAPPNVLLISLDTLRDDHLGSYGYPLRTSPRLDAFAKKATRYTNASSPASWTLPAHASLFTGLYPPEHGSQMVRKQPGAKVNASLVLHDDLTTLAEVLSTRGYRTAGLAANFMYLSPRYGLNQGFEHWKALRGESKMEAAPARKINAHALKWLRREREAPFFLFLNYMETHTPYDTTAHPKFPGHPVAPFTQPERVLQEKSVMDLSEPLPRAVIPTVVEQYDLAIRNLDKALGELFSALRAQGLFDDTLIVITADHGEYLGERRLLGHAKDALEGTLSIPLFVKQPGQTEGQVEQRLISLVHLPRLILEWAGLAEGVDSEVFPHRWPTQATYAQSRYSLWVDIAQPWGSRFDRIREVIYDASGHKFIESSDGAHELYQLSADPRESWNLLGEDAELLAEWKQRLEKVRPQKRNLGKRPEAAPLSPEELEGLKALGYAE